MGPRMCACARARARVCTRASWLYARVHIRNSLHGEVGSAEGGGQPEGERKRETAQLEYRAGITPKARIGGSSEV